MQPRRYAPAHAAVQHADPDRGGDPPRRTGPPEGIHVRPDRVPIRPRGEPPHVPVVRPRAARGGVRGAGGHAGDQHH